MKLLVVIEKLIQSRKRANEISLRNLPSEQRQFAISEYYSARNLEPRRSIREIINSPTFLDEFAKS